MHNSFQARKSNVRPARDSPAGPTVPAANDRSGKKKRPRPSDRQPIGTKGAFFTLVEETDFGFALSFKRFEVNPHVEKLDSRRRLGRWPVSRL